MAELKVVDLEVRRAEILTRLDRIAVIHGYRCGLKGNPYPEDANYSFRHGWRNGMVDSGRMAKTSAQAELAADFVRRKNGGVVA